MKKVLVTGADGFIGSHLTESPLEKGYDEKAKLYANNGGTSVRIVLGIVAAFICFGLALFFSAGPAAVERLQQTTPLPMSPTE